MNDYSKTFLHLKKSESLIKKKHLNLDNTAYHISKQKMFFKMNKSKKEKTNKESSVKKANFIRKISANASKILNKKRSNTYLDKGKYNYDNNETYNMKKDSNSKSFNTRKNKRNNNIVNSNSKILKRINENSRNHKSFFDNYDKNKIRKKMILNNNNDNSFNNMNKTTINNNMTQINEQKFTNSYFNTLINTDININKKKEDEYFSLSQNIGNRKNNILRKINTNISINKKKELILEDENEYNRTQNIFYDSKSKNELYSNCLLNKTNNNNSNNFRTEPNYKIKEDTLNINTNDYISKNDNNEQNTIQSKQPIKLYNDNNTTINLAGSYNFHQYFNTIINNRNNNNINSNNRNNKINLINRNYNRNKTTIDTYNNKIYNNINYCQTQVISSAIDKNTNNFFVSDKLIEDVNNIKDEMENNLKQNPTNSKSKKYNTLKHAFEKILKIFNDYFYNSELISIFNLLQQLIIGYHEVVVAFSSENRKLKELNIKLNEQYEQIDKKLIESKKAIKEKQNKIEILEIKLYGFINNMKKFNYNNIINHKKDEINLNNSFFEKYKNKEYNNINFMEKEKDDQYNKIRKINQNNLDDLDALYFFDKIEMKPQRSFSSGKIIPFLPFTFKK